MIAGKSISAQFVGDGQKVIVEAEHLDEPAKLADAVEATAEFREAWRQFEPAAEIEPCAAHADAVQSVQLRVADAVVDDGDATIIPLRSTFENIVHQPVVGAVNRRLHEDRALDAHGVVQSLHRREGAILRRCIERVAGGRISGGVAKDVQMGVAGIFWQSFSHGYLRTGYCKTMLASRMIGPHLAFSFVM